MQIVTQWLLQNFEHATTAVLLWHVQTFVAIQSPGTELQQHVNFHEIWILGVKNLSKMGS